MPLRADRKPRSMELAIALARDYAVERPEVALAASMTALKGGASGRGYDVTGVDALDAYAAVMVAAGIGRG